MKGVILPWKMLIALIENATIIINAPIVGKLKLFKVFKMKEFITAKQARKNLKGLRDSEVYTEIMEQLTAGIAAASETKTSLKIEDTNPKYQELFKNSRLVNSVLITLMLADFTIDASSIPNSNRFNIVISW